MRSRRRLRSARDAPSLHPAFPRRAPDVRLMAPLVVLVAGGLLLRAAGRLGVKQLSSWRSAGRAASAGMFMFTGATHFSPMKHDYAAMIPEPLPKSLRLIYLTGLLQIAGAIGLLVPTLRRLAGVGLVAQLVADRNLSNEEIVELKALIAAAEKTAKSRKGGS